MFDHDHSAARGLMTKKKLIVFKHESKFGNASANTLFDTVKVSANKLPARDFSDYTVIVPTQDQLPQGVIVLEM
jgi:CRISPR-associated protein Csd2